MRLGGGETAYHPRGRRGPGGILLRPVAVALACLIALTTLPAPAAAVPNDCAAAGATGCVDQTVPGAGSEPGQRYYVYLAAAQCGAGGSAACRGSPPANEFGLLWKETNGVAGLQRTGGIMPVTLLHYDPDGVVLY